MEIRFPTRDNVRSALVALLQCKGYDRPGDCVEVAILSERGRLPSYRITPASHAAPLLASELANITGRCLDHAPSWILMQADVNLLFGAVRQQTAAN